MMNGTFDEFDEGQNTPPPLPPPPNNYTITSLLFQNNRPIDWDVSQVQVQVNFAVFKLVQYKVAYRISRLNITYRFVDMCTETKVAEAFTVFKFSLVVLDRDLV